VLLYFFVARDYYYYYYYFFAVVPRVLKLAKVKMYVWNGYDGDTETVNMLARHTALKH